MFLSQIIRQYAGNTSVRYLDLCAAPGGKTTLALSQLSTGSLIVANEPIRQRANILAENTMKWGTPNVVVTNNYPDDFTPFDSCFDMILVDAPCSGEGMFRKDAGAITEWSLGNVRQCAARQLEIINSAWELLREGGVLIYSTCTYNTIENEDVIHYLINEKKGEPLTVETDEKWNISGALKGNIPVYRFLPHKTKVKDFLWLPFENHNKMDLPKDGNQGTKRKAKCNQSKPFRSHPTTTYKTLIIMNSSVSPNK